jgi:hypothetical protein
MTANVTALHSGRTRALVQRPKRRSHVASISPGETSWTAICGRYIPAEGAHFWVHDAAETGEQRDAEMCEDCCSITALIGWVLDQQTTPYRQAALR